MESTRCSFNHDGRGPQCCIESADVLHEGHHRFKCAGESCPGLVWPASVMDHLASCGLPKPQAAAVPAPTRRPDAFFFTLHTDNPGRIGAPPANEIGYLGYARVLAERVQPSYLGWVLAGRSVSVESPAAIRFPPATGTEVHVARYWGACSADGLLIFTGTLYPPIHIGDGITPQVNTSSLDAIARAIEENLCLVVKLLTTDEARRLKECTEHCVYLAPDSKAELQAAIDRVTAPAQGS